MWIGASAPVAIERAAIIGDAWLASPSTTLAQAAAEMAIYKAALIKHEKLTHPTIAIRRDIYVAESKADAASLPGGGIEKLLAVLRTMTLSGSTLATTTTFTGIGD